MKAILVIEMSDIPKNCMSCPLIDYHREYSIVCRHYQTGDIRPSWCPIKPLPKKKTPNGSDIFNDYVRGWNECVDEILGETE